jgi:hypothetical protein
MSETTVTPIRAWHFVGDTLRDGRPVPADGEWLTHDGPLALCASGLHASIDPWHALQYAPGGTLCPVELDGEVLYGDDKLVARRRRIVRRVDMTAHLRAFARAEALRVIHLWDAPDVVRQYLETGDESLRAAAWAAAWAAARAAGSAAGSAADAACAAARDAARDAAWAAARDAAWDAAWAPARAADRAASADRFRALVSSVFDEPQADGAQEVAR